MSRWFRALWRGPEPLGMDRVRHAWRCVWCLEVTGDEAHFDGRVRSCCVESRTYR